MSTPDPLRRLLLHAPLAATGPALAAAPAATSRVTTGPAPHVLRFAFTGAENGFDPAVISDTVSSALVRSIFDAPLTYDFLARPVRLRPQTTVAMPEVNADHTHFVFHLRPGIWFADDPVFKGRRRELVAEDYVFSIKRFYDPAVRSPSLFHFQGAGLLGLDALRQRALDTKQPFDYDTPVEGLRALDRHRFEVRVARPAPRLLHVFANGALTGALAREVVQAYAGKVPEHPVGTGPFRLAQWKRASRIVLERNPLHQGVWDEQPNADDAAGQAIAAQLKGRPLPLLDRVELAVIEEAQPRWLAFLNDELDVIALPSEFAGQAMPGRRLAPFLAKRGVQAVRAPQPTTWYTYFGMSNPMVGGYEPQQVALRRAIALAYDAPREIAQVRRDQTMPSHSVMPPLVSGYDAGLRSEMASFDPARAMALLDLHGFVDRNGDGWRERPDGSALQLEFTTQPDQLSRALQEVWKKSMDRIGVRITFRVASWQENIKASRAGKLMMWATGWSAALPDGSYFLDVMYGPAKGQANHARFDLPAFNALHERQRELPDGPERDALIAKALKLGVAYMPLKATGHVVQGWLAQPRVQGFVPHPFIRDWWRYVDVAAAPSTAAPAAVART